MAREKCSVQLRKHAEDPAQKQVNLHRSLVIISRNIQAGNLFLLFVMSYLYFSALMFCSPQSLILISMLRSVLSSPEAVVVLYEHNILKICLLLKLGNLALDATVALL